MACEASACAPRVAAPCGRQGACAGRCCPVLVCEREARGRGGRRLRGGNEAWAVYEACGQRMERGSVMRGGMWRALAEVCGGRARRGRSAPRAWWQRGRCGTREAGGWDAATRPAGRQGAGTPGRWCLQYFHHRPPGGPGSPSWGRGGSNMAVERTGHPAGVFLIRESVGCGPPLTAGVGLTACRGVAGRVY
jgi:hypothetical protein